MSIRQIAPEFSVREQLQIMEVADIAAASGGAVWRGLWHCGLGAC
jgi:hypothetical protein